MKTKNNGILQEIPHVCEPAIAECEVKKQVYSDKKRAREEETLVSKIYEQEVSKLHNQGLDLVSNIHVFANIKSSLYRSIYTT